MPGRSPRLDPLKREDVPELEEYFRTFERRMGFVRAIQRQRRGGRCRRSSAIPVNVASITIAIPVKNGFRPFPSV